MDTAATHLHVSLCSDMQYYVLPTRARDCHPNYLAQYNAIYNLWKSTMGDALRHESKEQEPELTSDEYIRQYETVGLFYQGNAIGLFILDWLNLASQAIFDHSYFAQFPASIINTIQQLNFKSIMTVGHLCVRPDWRRRAVGAGISEIIFGLAVKRMIESKVDALLTYTRNDRKTNELVYGFGGVPLKKDHLSHGIASDIIYIPKDSIQHCIYPAIQQVINELYKHRICGALDRLAIPA